MTWTRKDIILDIKRRKLNVDVTLPYWELRRNYCQARYTRAYLASGSFSFAHGINDEPPKKSESECQK